MAKRKTLPKDFSELIEQGDLETLKAVFRKCDVNAYGGYSKATALSFSGIPDELIIWLVEQGADIDARDIYQRTALHHQAGSWNGRVETLLDLGADIEALDYQDETPLFDAAEYYRPEKVKALIARGANITARNKEGLCPLEAALNRCANANIASMAEVAQILLDAGTPISEDARKSVERIGKEFEFYREDFNKDYLAETDAALSKLYRLFDVAPIEQRHTHDSFTPITVTSNTWQQQHDELWNYLVPGQSHAQTVQGEVIRITGKVAYEVLDNGGVNWDKDFRKMLAALREHLASGNALPPEELREADSLVASLHDGRGDSEPDRLCQLAVEWVLANPSPIPLQTPTYTR